MVKTCHFTIIKDGEVYCEDCGRKYDPTRYFCSGKKLMENNPK